MFLKHYLEKYSRVLFPGGATYFNQSNGYADAGQHIYEIAKELNDEGNYFPIFGTCLGFELLVILASGRGHPENRVTCRAFGNWPINFTAGELLVIYLFFHHNYPLKYIKSLCITPSMTSTIDRDDHGTLMATRFNRL